MNGNGLSTDPMAARFSDSLRRATSAETVPVEFDLIRVPKGDVPALRRIVERTLSPPWPVHERRTVNALAASDRSAETVEVLHKLATSGHEAEELRALAARGLGLMNPGDAEPALLSTLDSESALIRSEVFRALGSVGTSRALRLLERIGPERNSFAQAQLALATQLIRIRVGNDHEREPVDYLSPEWKPAVVAPLEGRELVRITKLLGKPYSVTLSQSVGLSVQCGRRSNLVLFDELMESADRVDDLLAQPTVVGVVVHQEIAGVAYSVSHLLLAQPSGKSVSLAVVAADGDPAYLAQGSRSSGTIHFEGREVSSQIKPTRLECTISEHGIVLGIQTLVKPATRRPARPIRMAG